MKAAFVGAIICAIAVVIISERCRDVSDCMVTRCSNDSKLICERSECTCSIASQRCLSQRDCYNLPSCSDGKNWHCVDNICRCY